MDKVVVLERAADVDGQPGSFGFSIMGGFGTKFPSCVCEVDIGGPADRTSKVGVARVGRSLLCLGGGGDQQTGPARWAWLRWGGPSCGG
jgi:hypothetical protein